MTPQWRNWRRLDKSPRCVTAETQPHTHTAHTIVFQTHMRKKPKKTGQALTAWKAETAANTTRILALTEARDRLQKVLDKFKSAIETSASSSKLPVLPKMTPVANMTKRTVEDFVAAVEATYTANGYESQQKGRSGDCRTAGLLTVFNTPVDPTHLGWVTDTLVKADRPWNDAKKLFIQRFGVIRDQQGPARVLLHEVSQKGTNRTAAEQGELVRRSVNDSLKTPDPGEAWANEHTVYTQILLESFQDPVRAALVSDKRLQDEMDKAGFHGVKELAITIEAELNSAAAFGATPAHHKSNAAAAGNGAAKICSNCGRTNHTKADCTREGGGRHRPRSEGGRERERGNAPRDRNSGRGSGADQRPGVFKCFACGETGHKAGACPKNSAAASISSVSVSGRKGKRSDDESDDGCSGKKAKTEPSTCALCRGGSHPVDFCPTVVAIREAQRRD